MPAVEVERSIRINAPADKVLGALTDFNEWPKWSPWLCMEPEAKFNVRGTPGEPGHGYDWNGKIVGAGDMQMVSNQNGILQMDLTFLRPFKSKAKVGLQATHAAAEETDVNWRMDSKLPFFLFFLTGMMKGMIGSDYERGLRMLKEYVETGKVNATTQIEGVVDIKPVHYVGVSDECAMNDIQASMAKTMPAAAQLVAEHSLTRAGAPGAVYHLVDMKSRRCRYSAVVPVSESRQIAGASTGTTAGGKAIKVIHTGAYRHLGNSWMAAFSYLRANKLKHQKGADDFEWYPTDPQSTPEDQLVTEIYVPVR